MGTGAVFVYVAVPSPLKEPLLYRIPEGGGESLAAGMRVLVPLGKRQVTGVVVGFAAETSLERVKDISLVLDERPILDANFLKLCRWTAEYYHGSLGEVLLSALPPALRTESQTVLVCGKRPDVFSSEMDRTLFEEVAKRGSVQRKSLIRLFPGRRVQSSLTRLLSMRALEARERLRGQRRERRRKQDEHRPKGSQGSSVSSGKLTLTEEQKGALEAIRERLQKGGFEAFLLRGVTGSGKTEVYLQAMKEVVDQGRQCLILVPEIALTPQLIDRLEERFPRGVAVLHSGLTTAERWRQWWRISRGEILVVVGARSALFAPVRDLGLIVVDEEHDSSYKQEEGIRYHARDLAVVRGHLSKCPVLLGSATPSIESFHNCRVGRYRLLELSGRVEQRPLPEVEIVDSRGEPEARSSKTIFSPRLVAALQENHARQQQSLIFLNRRGFANFLQCWSCGFVLRCPHCSISLTYHLKERRVYCHHCGFHQKKSEHCPRCGNLSFSEVGFGTEKLEEELRRLVPRARIGRMDRDTTSQRGAQERIFRMWERGELDILVGTQMIAKGHDVSGVTLVGVIFADLSLNLPDFRSVEKTFQLISQVAGRAGRGTEPGRVIVQTFAPDHYCFQYAARHDYPGFFEIEMSFREGLLYPPFQRLIHLRLEGAVQEQVARKSRELAQKLCCENPAKGGIEILGPAAAPIARLRNRYRWQILLKGPRGPALSGLVRCAFSIIPRRGAVRLHVDVDPYNML